MMVLLLATMDSIHIYARSIQDEKASGVHNLQGAQVALKGKRRLLLNLRRKLLQIEFSSDSELTQWLDALLVSGLERDDQLSVSSSSSSSTTQGKSSSFGRKSVFSAVRRLSISTCYSHDNLLSYHRCPISALSFRLLVLPSKHSHTISPTILSPLSLRSRWACNYELLCAIRSTSLHRSCTLGGSDRYGGTRCREGADQWHSQGRHHLDHLLDACRFLMYAPAAPSIQLPLCARFD